MLASLFSIFPDGAQAAVGVATIYSTGITSASNPWGIVSGAGDGNLWYVGPGKDKLAKLQTDGTITEYSAISKSAPRSLAINPLNTNELWYVASGAAFNGVAKFTTSAPGTSTQYSGATGAGDDIAAGPTAAGTLADPQYMWFTESSSNKIGKINIQGGTPTITEYTVPTASSAPTSIILGPDGKMWFTEKSGNKLGKIDPATGTFTEFAIPTASSQPVDLAVGYDNKIWFTEFNGNKIGKIDPSTATAASPGITEYSVPTASSQPYAISIGPDGLVWFMEASGNQIGSISTSGTIAEYALGVSGASNFYGLAYGPDGRLWGTNSNNNKVIATVANPPLAPTVSNPPPDPYNGTSTNIGITGVLGAAFECSVNNSTWSSCTSGWNAFASPWSLSTSDGLKYAYVRASTSAGGTSTITTISWTEDRTAPTQPSVSSVTTPTNVTSHTINFTLGESGGTVECKLDSGAWGSCASVSGTSGTYATGTLAEGAHTVYVRQTDTAGNVSTSGSVTWTIDTTAPAAPTITTSPSTPNNSTSASFSWTGEAGATYQCKIDSGSYAACSSGNTWSSLTEGSHTFYVKQTDQAGNTGSAATYTWTVDTTAPVAPTITASPADPVNSSSASFSWTGEAGGSYQCKIDSGAYASCTSAKAYAALAEGSHTFYVKQTDAANNTGAAATYTWTVDLTAPAAPTIVDKPGDPTNKSSASFSWTGEAGGSYQCKIDSGAYASCTSPKSYSGLSDASHTFYVKQTDAAGNTGTAATYTWTVDSTLPDAPVISGQPVSPTNQTTASLTISKADGATLYCKVDDGSYAVCSSPYDLTGLSEGTHTVYAKQTNLSGSGSGVASVSWTVDLTAPAAPSITASPDSVTQSTSASFSWTGEAGGSYQCKLDSGSWGACTSPQGYSGLSDGSHTFDVKQTDQAGNTGSAASYTWTVDTTAPAAPTITDQPGNPSGSSSASFSWTGEAGGSYQCKLDSGSWEACTSPKSYSGLSDASHTFYVKQTDAAGNTGSAATYTWTVDTIAPAAPTITDQPADPTQSTSASFSWTGEAGGSYQCKLDSGSWETCTSAKDYSGLSDGSHTFYVKQTDAAGNIGAAASYTWTVDTTAPSAPALTDQPSDPTASTSASFSWTGEAGGSYQCKLDSGSWETCTSAKDYSGLSDGSHTFQVRQIDAAGNTGDPASYTWTIDTSVPDSAPPVAPTITDHPGDPTQSTSASFSWTGEAGGSYKCKLDGGAYSLCTSAKDYSGLSDGSHTFYVKQTDQAGNTGDPASYTWTVDTTAPAAPIITDQPADPTQSTSASFSWTGEAGGSYQCKLDSGSWETCTSAKDYAGLSDSSHTFQVRQIDGAGNTGDPASYTWSVDTQTPLAPTLTDQPSKPSNSAAASFSWTGEAGGSYQCKLDSGSWETCTSAKDYSGLSDGSHTFQVRQVDGAGNTGAATSYTWTVDASAPSAPTITDKPDNPVSSAAASFSWTGEAGGSYQCKLDSGSWETCTSAKDYSGFSDGSHTFQVRQTDAAGNTGSAASYTWTVDTTAPSVPSLTDQPSDPSPSASASFSWTGEAGGSYQCKLDSGSWETCTSAKDYSSLADGSHTFQVRQIDAAGNTGDPASYTWSVDASAPSAPTITDKPDNPVSSAAASFSWTGEAGGSYQCKLDSGSWETCTSAKDYSGLADGSHTFQVRQFDGAGNTGSDASYTWLVDTTSPSAPTLTDQPNDPSAATSASFSWTGETGGSYQCKLDSGSWETCTPAKDYSGLSDGSHTFQVRQVDGAGNTGDPSSYTWTIDTTIPDTTPPAAPTITSKPSDPSGSTSASLAWTGEDGGSYKCKIDSGAYATCTSPKAYTGLPDGSHTFYVKQTDQAGNTSDPASYTWTVDTAAPASPTLSRTVPTANPTNSTSQTLTYSGEAGASFTCSTDGTNYSACGASPITLSGLSDGSKSYYVKATDAAGNTSSAASVTWTVDTTAPAAPTVTSKPSNPDSSTSASFAWTGEAGGSYQCKLDSGSWTTCTSPQNFSGLAEGSHTFQVRQTDAAGNTSNTASYTWTVASTQDAPVITSSPSDPALVDTASLQFTEPGTTRECKLDSSAWSVCTSPKVYTALINGTHTFKVRAKNSGGVASSETSYSWQVAVVPTISIYPANPVVSSQAQFVFAHNGAGAQCRLDSGAWETCASPKQYSGLSTGAHNFYVRAVDNASQVSDAASYAWQVNAPALPTLLSSPASPSKDSEFTFSVPAGASAQCRIDGGAWQPCTSPKAYSGLSNAPHHFQVRSAQDGVYSDPVSYSWTYDPSAPAQPTILSGPDPITLFNQAQFDFSGEDGAVFECRLDSGTWTTCLSPYLTGILALGNHQFQVRQTDAAGNTSAPRSFNWKIGSGPSGNNEEDHRLKPHLDTRISLDTTPAPVKGKSPAPAPALSVGCELQGIDMANCEVDVYAERRWLQTNVGGARHARSALSSLVVIGRGISTPVPGSKKRTVVKIVLNSTGRKMLALHVGGVPILVKLKARPVGGVPMNSTRRAVVFLRQQMVVPADGMFDFGRAKLTGRGRWFTENLARVMTGNVTGVRCVGHTDSKGSDAYNYRLGLSRAKTVCALLHAWHPRLKIQVVSAGERRPRASNKTDRGRALNRRVEIILSYR